MNPSPPGRVAALAVVLPLLPLHLAAVGEPTNLRSTTPFLQRASIELSWIDNCDDELGFEIQFFDMGNDEWVTLFEATPNDTLLPVRAGGPNESFQFRVRTILPEGRSDWTPPVTATNPADIAIFNSDFMGGTVGELITGPTPGTLVNPNGALVTFSVSDLPDGFSFDPATGVISGTPTAAGLFRPIVSAHHPDGVNTASTFVTIRIKHAPSGPVEDTPIPDALFLAPPTTPLCLDLAGHFHDPDTTSAARISTNLGDIDVIFHPEACPATVENFFTYVDRGDYADVIFHRSAITATSGVDVVQAGWFKPDGDGTYTKVFSPYNLIDEPGLSNVLGSIAMAKTNALNSATSQWYFNSVANLNLDGPRSNGGFTVFGRATPASLPVIADLHNRPRGDYTVPLDLLNGLGDEDRLIGDWPTTVAPAGPVPAPDELVQIQSVTRIEDFLAYTVPSNSNPAVVTAGVNGSELKLTPVPGATGTSTLTVEVTDLDGTVLPVEISYCVLDLDLVPGVSPNGKLAVTFTHEKFPANLSYEVQSSLDGENWTTFWRTSDGLGVPAVITNNDLGTQWRLTVEDDAIAPLSTPAALVRIVVTKG